MVWSLHEIDLVDVGDGGSQNDRKPWKLAENDGQCWLNEIEEHPGHGT
jgi:hypothetical protein